MCIGVHVTISDLVCIAKHFTISDDVTGVEHSNNYLIKIITKLKTAYEKVLCHQTKYSGDTRLSRMEGKALRMNMNKRHQQTMQT